jgi:phage terminase large subunit-like protein
LEWAKQAVSLYHARRADRIVAERNNGGELVEQTIRSVDPNASYSSVWASRGKVVRAEPISALYFTIAFEKCNSLKAAEAAARRLLVEKAEHFSKWTGIEPRVYTELEWSPRKKGEAASEGPFF